MMLYSVDVSGINCFIMSLFKNISWIINFPYKIQNNANNVNEMMLKYKRRKYPIPN